MGRFLTVARSRAGRRGCLTPLRAPPAARGVEGGVVTGAEAGTGAPILLLHGLGGTWEYWGRTIELLAGRARCIALDLPGFGQSDAPAGGFDARLGGRPPGRRAAGAGRHARGRRAAIRWAAARRALARAPPRGRLAPRPGRPERTRARSGLAATARCAPCRSTPAAARAVPLGALAPAVAPLRRAGCSRRWSTTRRPSIPALAQRLVAAARGARELHAGARRLVRDRPRPRSARSSPCRSPRSGATATAWCRPATPTSCGEPCLGGVHFLPGCGHMPMVERPEAFAACSAAALRLARRGSG